MAAGRSDAGAGRQPTDHELVSLAQSLPPHNPRQAAACEELMARHESIIRSCVQRYRGSPEPADDLMQVGYVALLRAILNFDPRLGESLAVYAQPCISGEIKRYSRDSPGDFPGFEDQAVQQTTAMQSA
jgi:RNA polymerase sigma factor (sigma-70 family)